MSYFTEKTHAYSSRMQCTPHTHNAKHFSNSTLPKMSSDLNAKSIIKPDSLLAIAMSTAKKHSELVEAKFEATLNSVLPLIKKLVYRACQNIQVQEKWKNEAKTDPEFWYKYSACESDDFDAIEFTSSLGLIKIFTAAEFEYIDTAEAFTLLKNTLQQQPLNVYKYLQIDDVPDFYKGAVFTIKWCFDRYKQDGREVVVYFSFDDYECEISNKMTEMLIE